MKTYKIILLIIIIVTNTFTINAQSWSAKSRPIAKITHYFSVDFADGASSSSTIGYLIGNWIEPASSNVFFKTYNSGNSWSGPINISSSPGPICHPGAVACSSDANVVIIVGGDDYLGTHSVIKRSTNGGLSFTNDIFLDGPGRLTDVQIFQNMAVAVGLNGRILINPNINNSCWYNVSKYSMNFKNVSIGYDTPLSSYYIYISGNSPSVVRGIIKDLCSVTQGQWDDFIPSQNNCNGISILSGNPRYIVTTSQSIFATYPSIYYSANYGSTWTPIPLTNYMGYYFYDIACTGSYIYYAGYNSAGNHFILRQNPLNNTFQNTNLGAPINPYDNFCSLTFSKMANNQYFGYFVGENNNFYVSTSTYAPNPPNNEPSFKDEEFITKKSEIDISTKELEILNISPNPATTQCVLAMLNKYDGVINIDIFDLSGKRINSDKTTLQAGILGQYALDLSTYKPGSYIIRITSNGFSDTKPLLVK